MLECWNIEEIWGFSTPSIASKDATEHRHVIEILNQAQTTALGHSSIPAFLIPPNHTPWATMKPR